MKKLSFLAPISTATVLITASTILTSCSNQWDNHFLDLEQKNKELETTLPKTSCVFSVVLKEKLDSGEYLSLELELSSVSDSGITIKANSKANITDKLVYFTVNMENLPEGGTEYWAKFNVTFYCKKANDDLIWASNKLTGFKITAKAAA